MLTLHLEMATKLVMEIMLFIKELVQVLLFLV